MYIRVSVYPNAKKEELIENGQDKCEVRVKEPAERNLANSRVMEILALQYRKNKKSIRLVSGHHSSRKIFSIED